MKNGIITLFLLLAVISGFAQSFKYEYAGRFTPTVKKEKLNGVKTVSEITPELWRSIRLSSAERMQLDERLDQQRMVSAPQAQTVFPQEKYVYPQEYYNAIIDYVSVEISGICNGKIMLASSTSDVLTAEQKALLNTADAGSDINFKIMFRYKNQASADKVIEGASVVTVVPETEASYPGGNRQITEYLSANFIDKVTVTNAAEKIQNAVVKFTINELGEIVDCKITRTSTDPQIDQVLLEAINKMPKWKPAENSKGERVKQEFVIPFGGGGC